jgi:hypothetical protein
MDEVDAATEKSYSFMQVRKWYALGSVVIKALCFKPEGRVFGIQWGELIFAPQFT